jgi:hypothetical protein
MDKADTVITLPITEEALPHVKGVIRGILMAFPTDRDRLDVIGDFCIFCGSLDKSCKCWGRKV